ncbi:hypothetical protein CMI37_30685 [Candidatus Pacearchaeota archaeon]|nr:hypothetical protein [Candidatus Pacearchaeota archaeon]|tara:strand:- start:142 stop:708 length:567 start_codon:yes stop_codon:yes gene_type:complete
MPDFTDIFGEDFEGILEQLDNLTPEQEILLLAVIEKATLQAEMLEIQIQTELISMINNGMTRQGAEMAIKVDLKKGGKLHSQLTNYIKSAIVEGVNQSSRLGQYEEYDLDRGTFKWVTVAGHRICEDCEKRAGDIGTFEYHASTPGKGLPGAGWSICKQYCYCVLDPTGDISTNVNVPTESGIRERGA